MTPTTMSRPEASDLSSIVDRPGGGATGYECAITFIDNVLWISGPWHRGCFMCTTSERRRLLTNRIDRIGPPCPFKTYTVGEGAPAGPVVYEKWNHSWLGGLIGEPNVGIDHLAEERMGEPIDDRGPLSRLLHDLLGAEFVDPGQEGILIQPRDLLEKLIGSAGPSSGQDVRDLRRRGQQLSDPGCNGRGDRARQLQIIHLPSQPSAVADVKSPRIHQRLENLSDEVRIPPVRSWTRATRPSETPACTSNTRRTNSAVVSVEMGPTSWTDAFWADTRAVSIVSKPPFSVFCSTL